MGTRSCPSVLAAAAGLLLLAAVPSPGPALAQDSGEPRYAAWEGGQDGAELAALIAELEALIAEAEKSKAANPVFLRDLKDTLARYEAAAAAPPSMARVLSDDFADGNYTASPAWKVSAGQYRVETSGNYTGLRSTIAAQPAIAEGNPLAGAILGAILQPQGAEGGDKHASIYTTVKISNEFRIRLELASKLAAGRLDLGPYQGASAAYAYRLAYFPGARPGLKLLRVTPQGTATIAAHDAALRLEDGRRHLIEWVRDGAGAMTVTVDGKALISATDTALKDPFAGFLVINSGGDYAIHSIAIDARS